MTLHDSPQFSNRTSPLDSSIARLMFMFGQLEAWQVESIISRVHRALPVPVARPEEESTDTEALSKADVAQRGVVQLLYLIAAQTYADILFALTYAETLAMMSGADFETQGTAH
ncbi:MULTISPECIES: hypothetical protein [Kordiimonas]|uniref:hypothetical protein n=1 Tax=Kordiimonas TaxID=288021 RepID=UPI00257C3815|nr:hypothetical protein [Kordiimonas sp. UBA4487]